MGDFHTKGRWDAALFGEAQSRVVVSVSPQGLAALQALAKEMEVPTIVLGQTGGKRFQADDMIDVSLAELDHAWRNGIEEALNV